VNRPFPEPIQTISRQDFTDVVRSGSLYLGYICCYTVLDTLNSPFEYNALCYIDAPIYAYNCQSYGIVVPHTEGHSRMSRPSIDPPIGKMDLADPSYFSHLESEVTEVFGFGSSLCTKADQRAMVSDVRSVGP
jgi:hypothetical protein